MWPGVSSAFRRTRPNSITLLSPSGVKVVFCLRFGAKINRRAYAISQFQMPGYKVGVQMSQDHMLDLKFMFGSKF